MSFVAELNQLPLSNLVAQAHQATTQDVEAALAKPQPGLIDFARLISPAGQAFLEPLGRRSHELTQQRFGKVIRLFAPLYLSNECINNCRYCGFARDNPIVRVTLSLEEARREARLLQRQGFRNLLLVAGEHPRLVNLAYLVDCVRTLHQDFPSISLEVAPLSTADYRELVRAGADGLVVYQETYDREVYQNLHDTGPKRNFELRLETPERAYAAGIRRLGIGALLGLADWRSEMLGVAAHAQYLLRHCWKAILTISLPRLRPHAGHFHPPVLMSDRDLAQTVCALRLLLPDVGLVLSTRERPALRDGLIPLGITLISAGSHTEPGGYTGAGREKAHLTVRGQVMPPPITPEDPLPPLPALSTANTQATVQFDIADNRTPNEVTAMLQRLGYEPVWKDWDAALTA